MSKMHRSDATAEDLVLRKKEEKDVELDKKIIALRKKNEALMRRYQEIEEDRKRAEQEGMAVTSRRPRADGLTITITKAHNEKRVVSEKWGSSCSAASSFGIGSEEEEDDEEADHLFTFKMGKRMQLAVTMDNKAKGKRIVSEKRGSECLGSPGDNPDISEEEMDQLVAFRRGRRMQIAITMDNKSKVQEKRTMERRKSEGDKHSENILGRKERGKSPQKSPGDKGCTLPRRERSEYVQWKKERDQIDLERLARHKNARGEWRRAWDIEKSERLFEDTKDEEIALDYVHSKKGTRNVRKSQHRSLPSEGKSGRPYRMGTSESASRTLPVMSSNVRGKDRLTGRARRWDVKEAEELPFVKDDLDNQRLPRIEQLKNQSLISESVKEHNCTTRLDKNVKPQEAQDNHSLLMPQAQRCGKSPFADEGQGSSGKTRKCLAEEMLAFGMDGPEAESKLRNTIGADQSPKGRCMNSSSCQGMAQNVMQTSGCAIKEISSAENDLAQNTHFEKNPSEECAENHSELLLKAEVDAGSEGLSPATQAEGETQTLGLKMQRISEKENDTTACLVHREEFCSLNQEIPDKTNAFVQDGAKMRNNRQDQSETCNKEAKN
ncbi:coiled-coil domain-containing protein 9B [Heteronotia binoei]|uniref:coiled-coil domain-containing protein 9B n=1 Tax=Heteronotia binoei TaxID=13085 RepID=UPI00292CBBA3|nr:coiled-coil domain-containing protein 9B [Heteronotia binoei]